MGFTKRNVIDDDFKHQRFQFLDIDSQTVVHTYDMRRLMDTADTIGTSMNRGFQMPIENFLGDEVDPHLKNTTVHITAAERSAWNDKPSNSTFNNSISTVNASIGTVNTNLNNHINNTTVHITASERSTWNAKAPTASPAFTGTPTAPTGTDYGTARIRNIYAGTSDMTPGSSSLSSGNIYLVYE